MIKILKFSSSWCSPCKTLSKTLEEVKPLYPELEIEEIDVEENDELASSFSVMALPTMVFVVDDIPVRKTTGSKSKEQIIELIEKYK